MCVYLCSNDSSLCASICAQEIMHCVCLPVCTRDNALCVSVYKTKFIACISLCSRDN